MKKLQKIIIEKMKDFCRNIKVVNLKISINEEYSNLTLVYEEAVAQRRSV